MGNSLEGFSDKIEPPIGAQPITEKETERGHMIKMSNDKYDAASKEPSDIRFAVSSMQGWRATMEDTHILAPSLKISKNKARSQGSISKATVLLDHALFCVFDGHGGDFTSNYASKNFSRVLRDRPELEKYANLSDNERKEVPGIKLLKDALSGAFLDIDLELKNLFKRRIEMYGGNNMQMLSRGRNRNQSQDEGRDSNNTQRDSSADAPKPRILVDRSGSTAVMVLLTPDHIICCNAGDSRAILCRGKRALPLSFDHKPVSPTEIDRVKSAGGFVRYKRIDGDLAVSRGLGDFRFKMNEHVPYEKQKVSMVPDLIVCPRDPENDEFMVIGCDGIWDVINNQECANIVQGFMDEGESDLGSLCESMLTTCLEKNSKDNMTVCVVSLPACAMKFSSSS
jgi:protein phosphatase 1B